MRNSRVFGVNQRGDNRWLAWTCLSAIDGRVTPGTFEDLSIHDEEQEAQAAADAARERFKLAMDPQGARMSEIERAQAQRDGLLKPMRPGNQAAGSGLARSEPHAWLVAGGRMFVDKAYVDEAHAETAIIERKDGATLAALYTAEQVCQLIADERERCARVAEGTTKFGAYANGNTIPDEIAAAIRRGSV